MKVTKLEIMSAIPVMGNMMLVAQFDIEISPEIRLFKLRLLRAPDGSLISYAPNAKGGGRCATFARPLAERITAAEVARFV